MRLINVETLKLQEFSTHETPPYAILSHTWGDGEVTLKDLETGDWQTRQDKIPGRDKIIGCCKAAASEGYRYIWIDTCCIDKTSSAELSEAINSMFWWYQESAICYAYLSDVDSEKDPEDPDSDFAKSRWFTRGWTLQELLAPTEVVFLGRDWVEIGTKTSLQEIVTTITRVSGEALQDQSFGNYSVAQRMSWAAGRRTTRTEDEAYCLMGLFDVNMPLLYGEGTRAFFRLQEEIMKRIDDDSIFAWSNPRNQQSHVQVTALLASSPNLFKDSSEVVTLTTEESTKFRSQGKESFRSYLNRFELVRQLVRVRMPVLGPLKGIKMVSKSTDSELQSISEIMVVDSSDSRLGHNSPHSLENHVPELQVGADEEIVFVYRNRRVRLSELSDHVKNLAREELINPLSKKPLVPTERRPQEQQQVESGGHWRWYIYEPVTILPLMCAVNNRRLAVLLSPGSFRAGEESVLYRLHSPSLVCVDDISKFPETFSSSLTIHVLAFATHNIKYGGTQLLGTKVRPFISTSEVRIANILSRGYELFGEKYLDWGLSIKDEALVWMKNSEKHRYGDNDRKDIVLFEHKSGDTSANPSFFLEIDFETPVIGVLDGRLPLTAHSVKSADMTSENQAQFSMGTSGQVIFLKRRTLPRKKYLSISIEPQALQLKFAPVSPILDRLQHLNLRLNKILSAKAQGQRGRSMLFQGQQT